MKGIYKIECIVTGITYIGSTSVSFTKRWRKHKQRLRHNYHENSYLQNAWNKYGKENFRFEVVERLNNNTRNEIKEREYFWLSKYFSKGRDYCFNLSDHTDGGNTVKDEKTRKKLSESIKASYTPELRASRSKQGKSRGKESAKILKETMATDEWKKAHLEGVRKLAKNKNWLQKNKESKEHLKVKVGTNRGEVFESVTEAARQTNAHRSNIRLCIKGEIKTCMDRKWFYYN